MNIQTKYNYEKNWSTSSKKELLKIIEEEVGNANPEATLNYVIEVITKGKIISVGSCKFRIKNANPSSKCNT